MDRINKSSRLALRQILILIASFLLAFPCTVASQEQSPHGPYIIGNGVKAPVPTSHPLPAYTEEARAFRIEGIVLIQAVIRKDGTADSFRVLRGLGYGLDESTLNTITEKWRFQPGTLNGGAVDVQANIEVSFRLSNKTEDREVLNDYPLRAQIIETKWDQDSGKTAASGYGNLWAGGFPRGFTFESSCGPTVHQVSDFPAKWNEPESKLEIVTAVEWGMKTLTTCEIRVTNMRSTIFTLKDGQVVAVDPPTPNRR